MKKAKVLKEKDSKIKVRFWEKSMFPPLPIIKENAKEPQTRPNTPAIQPIRKGNSNG
jgi:hypothetical protein